MFADNSIGFIELQCVGAAHADIMGFSFTTQQTYTDEDYLLQLTGISQLEYGKFLFIILVIHSHKLVGTIFSFCTHLNGPVTNVATCLSRNIIHGFTVCFQTGLQDFIVRLYMQIISSQVVESWRILIFFWLNFFQVCKTKNPKTFKLLDFLGM